MIKITLQHGKLTGQPSSVYGVRVICTDTENPGSCDSLFSTPGLDRLSKGKLENLFKTLEFNINQCIKGYHGVIPTIEYPKIAKADPENKTQE